MVYKKYYPVVFVILITHRSSDCENCQLSS